MTAPDLDLDALERLPPDGQVVYVPGGVAYRRDGAWYSLTGYGWPGAIIDWPVTWWLPLDALPDLIEAARERDALLQRAEQAEAERDALTTVDGVWRCEECGERVSIDGRWRWVGTRWEHHHGYPVGHIPARYLGKNPSRTVQHGE